MFTEENQNQNQFSTFFLNFCAKRVQQFAVQELDIIFPEFLEGQKKSSLFRISFTLDWKNFFA